MNLDFKTIVPALKAGDKKAWDALMERFYGWSVTQAKRVIRDPEEAHNTAVKFWAWLRKGVMDYDPTKGTFYAWMTMRLRYQAMSAVKKQQPRIVYGHEIQEESSDAQNPINLLGALQDIEGIAEQLKPAQRDLFWQLIEGATAEEIAEGYNISVQQARNQIARIRQVIRANLNDE